MRRILYCVTAILICELATAADADKYDLQYRFRKGEVLRTEVLQQVSVDVTIKDSNQTDETRSGSVKTWQIESADAGKITFVHSVESIKLWQKQQGKPEISYDSTSGDPPRSEYEAAAKSVGVPLTTFTIDVHGKILDRESAQPGSVAAHNDQILLLLPEKPVALGEYWTTPQDIDITLPQSGRKSIRTRQQCVMEKIEHGIAHIKVDSQVLTPIDDPQVEAQLIQRMSSGTVLFDIEAGRMVEQQMDVDRRIVGVSGPGSVMHYQGRFSEKTLPAEQQAKRAGTSRE
jgi:hypothetical protein